MRSRFDEQLMQLNTELIQMGALCEEAISTAIYSLMEGDRHAAGKVSDVETEIDQMEREIESLCMKLLLRQQPVARDLRTISSALKMISDMERIGDQADDIAEITKFIKMDELESKLHLKEMAKASIGMVTDSVESFVKKDLELAKQIAGEDDKVDALFLKVKQELIDLLKKDQIDGELCLDILMIAKYLERIGDHAVNISEWVQYSITGIHSHA